MAGPHPIPTHANFKDLRRHPPFGQLTVVAYAGPAPGHQLWECLCSCGRTTIVRSNNLLTGHVTSCGCVQMAKFVPGAHTTHRRTRTREWQTWQRMKQRCINPDNPGYPDYGGRGITICARWLESFESFLADMGSRPGKGYSIGRINNDGPYCPENCRWETVAQQMRNRRCTRRLTLRGRTMTLAEWARETGVTISTLHVRLQRGWTAERALTTPPQQGRRFQPFTFIA